MASALSLTRIIMVLRIGFLSLAPMGSFAQKDAPSSSFCTYNESTQTWKIGNAAVQRIVHFDAERGSLKTTEFTNAPGRAVIADLSASDATIDIIDMDGKAKSLSLEKDWGFAWQVVGRPEHGGRTLTIHLQGSRANAGFEIEAMYEVWAKDSPMMTKTITLINRKEKPVSIVGGTLARWVVQMNPLRGPVITIGAGAPPPKKPASFVSAKDGSGSLVKVIEGEGFTTAITGDEKSVTLENGSMIVKSRETVELKPDTGRGSLPTLLAFAWSGPNPTGPMLLERFRGAKH